MYRKRDTNTETNTEILETNTETVEKILRFISLVGGGEQVTEY